MRLYIVQNSKLNPVFVKANLELVKKLPSNIDCIQRKILLECLWQSHYRARISQDWKTVDFEDKTSFFIFLMKFN